MSAKTEAVTSMPNEPDVAPVDPVIAQQQAELSKDVSIARSRQDALLRTLKDRKTMPVGLAVGMSRAEPDVELLRRVAPECLEPWVRENRMQTDEERRQSRGVFHWGATHRAHMAPESDHKSVLQNGWEPVKEADGTHAAYGSCKIYRRPVELSRAEIRAAEVLSDERVKAHNQDLQNAADEIGTGMNVHVDQSVVTKRSMREVPGFTLKD